MPAGRANVMAESLVATGDADLGDSLDEIVAAARDGRSVVTLDGCASACGARLLEARGIAPAVELDLGRVNDADLALITPQRLGDLGARTEPSRRAKRLSRLESGTDAAAPGRAHSTDDYLLALDSLTTLRVECGALIADAPTLASHVSHALHVSRPTAGETLARLERDGYVERNTHKEILLTAHGRAEADRVIRAQRILERFVTDILGYTAEESYERAREISPGFDAEALERVYAALGAPTMCPHGWPVDAAEGRASARELTALSAAVPGDRIVVDRLEESARARLPILLAAGLTPGREITVTNVDHTVGTLEISCDGTATTLSLDDAAGAFVRS